MRPRPLLAVLVAVVALAGLAAASSGANTAARIKIPKVTSYPVRVNVSGFVDLNWTWDSHHPCVPGYLKTIKEELSFDSFESGKPRRGAGRGVVSIINNKVTLPAVIGGHATLKAHVKQFKTTNYCPPAAPVPNPPKPRCKTLEGKLGVTLSPEKVTKEEEELFNPSAGDPVLVQLTRRGGGRQTNSCAADRPTPHAIDAGRGVRVETLLAPSASWIALPLKSRSMDFFKLKEGQRLSEGIRISGRCDRIAAHASSLPEDIKSCKVRGRIDLTITRVG